MTQRATALLFLVIALATTRPVCGDDPDGPDPVELFEQRIMPIFKSPQPASCTQCHLADLDLKNYILPSHEQTFVSLRDQGLIELAAPEKSKILAFIDKGRDDPDQQARLIHEKTRQAEHEAFLAWISACCRDPKLRNLPPLESAKLAGPEKPAEVIRHARKSRVVDSFVRNVWSQRMRCFPCHTPHELDPDNPRHRVAIQRHKQYLEQDNKAFANRMVLFKETPEATLEYMIEKSRQPAAGELPLVNLDDPGKSLLVLKPTSKLPAKDEDGKLARPSYAEPVSHMGGLKMHVDDQSYKSFVAWIRDYARVVKGRYTSVADLPADNWYPSKHVIFLNEVPDVWPDGVRVQLFVHAWNDRRSTWEAEPLAFTQNSVTPRRNVAGVLFLFARERQSESSVADLSNPEAARLAAGKYLLKLFLDRNGRLSEEPTLLLGDEDYVGQVEIQAKWGEGFPAAEKISGKLLK